MKCQRLFLILIVLCLSIAAGVWVASSPNNPHDFSGQCDICHLEVPPASGGELIFNYDIDYLCNYCHEIPSKNSHPSQMVPSMVLPAGFPRDWQGRMTCTTCHDPHMDNWGINTFLLRGGVTGRNFCALCHQELDKPGSQHRIAEIVHAKNALTPTYDELSGTLDRVSLECIGCHDGTVGKVTDFKIAGEEILTFAGRSMSHPIGMIYSESAQNRQRIRPLENLSPLITLIDGKVGCSSCHNQFSHELTMLATSNKGSSLCMQCHDM